jgi:hypothetical protein
VPARDSAPLYGGSRRPCSRSLAVNRRESPAPGGAAVACSRSCSSTPYPITGSGGSVAGVEQGHGPYWHGARHRVPCASGPDIGVRNAVLVEVHLRAARIPTLSRRMRSRRLSASTCKECSPRAGRARAPSICATPARGRRPSWHGSAAAGSSRASARPRAGAAEAAISGQPRAAAGAGRGPGRRTAAPARPVARTCQAAWRLTVWPPDNTYWRPMSFLQPLHRQLRCRSAGRSSGRYWRALSAVVWSAPAASLIVRSSSAEARVSRGVQALASPLARICAAAAVPGDCD